MWKTLIRPGMIFIPFTLGALLPQAHVYSWLIRWALVFMLYMVCLQLKFAKLKPQKEHFRLVTANILLGIGPYLLFHFLGREELALAAFFVGITPTANAAPVVIGFLHGRVEFVVTGFAMTNAGVSLALLVLLPLVTGNPSLEFVGRVAEQLLIIMCLPLVLAMITRLIIPRAKEWPSHCRTLQFGAWSFTLFLIAAGASYFFKTHPDVAWTVLLEIAAISLLLCMVNFILGFWLGNWRLRRECSQTLGQKNTTFTLYLAMTFVNPLVAMGPVFYVLWHNCWNALQMFWYDRRRTCRYAQVHAAANDPD